MRLLAFLLGLFAFVYAFGNDDRVARVADADINATASRLRTGKIGPYPVVFGYLTIRGNSKPLRSADLECFALQVGSSKSDGIWVDSFVDTLRGDYPARNGTVGVAVYWPMNDFKGATEQELRTATLSIIHPFLGPCFEFDPPDKR